jgi:methylation protein EvaC
MYDCHICGSRVEVALDFGKQPLANTYPWPGESDKTWYNAAWAWCDSCQLLQLVDVPAVTEVFNADYPYLTDQSDFMVHHFRRTARLLECLYDLASKNVLEIGCNSGGIIEFMPMTNRLGIEPASAAQKKLSEKNIPFWNCLFNLDKARDIRQVMGTYDLIYAANTMRSLAHLDDFFKGVLEILSDSGVFVFEEPYLFDILQRTEFDQFYSENVYGFTVTAVSKLAARYGLELIRVNSLPDNHGGSLRYHIARYGAYYRDDVSQWTEQEENILKMCGEMQQYAAHIKDEFRQALIKAKQPLVGYGATAKSSTILNWAGIGSTLIPVIYDSTPTKIGRVTPGTHIPIVDATMFKDSSAKTVVLFPYNLKQEIIPRENAVKPRQWLLYAPQVHYD